MATQVTGQEQVKVVRIPLVGQYTNRFNANNQWGPNFTKDQYFLNGLSERVVNPVTEKQLVYTTKRPGLKLYNDFGASFGAYPSLLFSDGVNVFSTDNGAQPNLALARNTSVLTYPTGALDPISCMSSGQILDPAGNLDLTVFFNETD